MIFKTSIQIRQITDETYLGVYTVVLIKKFLFWTWAEYIYSYNSRILFPLSQSSLSIFLTSFTNENFITDSINLKDLKYRIHIQVDLQELFKDRKELSFSEFNLKYLIY